MPKEIPGFYYDEEKNRYFPVKGPIPGSKSVRKPSSSAKSTSPASAATTRADRCGSGSSVSSLVLARELDGNILDFRAKKRRRCAFEAEVLNSQVSQPQVWKYDESGYVAEGALEIITTNMITPEGERRVPVLLGGSIHGLLSSFVVGNAGKHLIDGVKCTPSRVWPCSEDSEKRDKPPAQLWKLPGASAKLSSDISCIRSPQKPGSTASYTMITTLGSDRVGGSVYVLNPAGSFDPHTRSACLGQVHNVASFSSTIWTADCSSNKSQAVVGTNRGAALVDMENGKVSRVFHSGSDVIAQQFIQSGNGVLCGLRNGAILTVDVREGHRVSSTSLRKHVIPCSTSNIDDGSSTRKGFKVTGNIYPSCTTYMPKSVSSCMTNTSWQVPWMVRSSCMIIV